MNSEQRKSRILALQMQLKANVVRLEIVSKELESAPTAARKETLDKLQRQGKQEKLAVERALDLLQKQEAAPNRAPLP
jgi:hypothetical protein